MKSIHHSLSFACLSLLSSALLVSACSNDAVREQKQSATADQSAELSQPILTQSMPKAYFGELHIHTQNSFDAYTMGVRATPENAYRYARGEAIDHVSGQKIQNQQPLDFIAITDHAEYLGILPTLVDPQGPLSGTAIAKEILSGDRDRARAAMKKIVYSISSNPPVALDGLMPAEIRKPLWQSYITLADQFYEPGVFTTLVGFEWTLIPDGKNLHRNVIFRGTDVPALPFSAFDSDKPEELWQWLDEARANGSDVLAIPHNSNISDGLMFQLVDSWGKPIDKAYADARMRNEPLVEITQIKGTSETHPGLSPNDEWANFEIMGELLGASVDGKINGSYVREAYLKGLKLAATDGFNPYQFGLIGASDSHNSSVPVEEDNYTGKIGHTDGTPEARLGGSALVTSGLKYSASGLTGVWAKSNTREGIFDALKNKEVFATSGPRMSVLLFAGDFTDALTPKNLSLEALYAQGKPMGSEMKASKQAPSFYAWASRDANNAPLQRLQIIKGWVGDDGIMQERVFDIACSDNQMPDPMTHRCPDNGAKLDMQTCDIDETTGAQQLVSVWQDPTHTAGEHAFYYARVLENPTCRWSSWDALRNNWPLPKSVPATLQERAWSSPIWFKPQA